MASVAPGSIIVASSSPSSISTTNGALTAMLNFVIPLNVTYGIRVSVNAVRTGGTSGASQDSGRWVIDGVFKNIAGVLTQVGTTTFLANNSDQQAWLPSFTVSGNQVTLNVTGATNNNIDWTAIYSIEQVS